MSTRYKDSRSKFASTSTAKTSTISFNGNSNIHTPALKKKPYTPSHGLFSNKPSRPRKDSFQQAQQQKPAPISLERTMKPLIAVAGGLFILVAGLNTVVFDPKNSKPEPTFVQSGAPQTSTQILQWNPLGIPTVPVYPRVQFTDGTVPLPLYWEKLQEQKHQADVIKRKADFRATAASNAEKRAAQRDTILAGRAKRIDDRAVSRVAKSGLANSIADIIVTGYPTIAEFPISAIDTAAITVLDDTFPNGQVSSVGETDVTGTGTGIETGIDQFLDTLSVQDLERIFKQIDEIVDENKITKQEIKKTYSSYYTIGGVILGVGTAVAITAATAGTAAIPTTVALTGTALRSGAILALGYKSAVAGTTAFAAYSALPCAIITPGAAAAGAAATTLAAAATAGGVVGGFAGAAVDGMES